MCLPFIWKRLSVDRQLLRDIDHDHVDSCKNAVNRKTVSLSFAIYCDYIDFIQRTDRDVSQFVSVLRKTAVVFPAVKPQQETYVLGMLFALHAKIINRIQRYVSM